MADNKKKLPCPPSPTSVEDTCETPKSSCSELSTSTGNILDRIIVDPSAHREPCLKHWRTINPKADENTATNIHQYKASMKSTQITQMCFLRVNSDPNPYRQPAIIGTVGPSCATVDSIVELLEAGMNVARVNMAHADPCNKSSTFQQIIEATNIYGLSVDCTVPIGIVMDLNGSEIRTGRIDPNYLKDPTVPQLSLTKGQIIRLTSDKIFENRCNDRILYVNCENLSIHVQPGMTILISDTEIRLRVEVIESFHIVCEVELGGLLRNFHQVHIPMLPLPMPLISDYDLDCLKMAVELELDAVIVPKVRNEEVIRSIKATLVDHPEILVLAKISNYEGLRNIDSIISAADGIVLHDLCLELSPAKVFVAQKEVIAKCNAAGKPIICSVKVSDVSNAAQCIVDGADNILLTEETAIGPNGPNSIKRLCEIIREAEATTMQSPYYYDLVELLTPSVEPSIAIALAAVEMANKIRASAILTITTSGRTAHLLSWFRPRCPVIAVSRQGKTARQLNLWRSVVPLFYADPPKNDWFEDCCARIQYGIAYGKSREIIRPGDPLVLVTGYRKSAGFTNCLRIVFASVQSRQFADNTEQHFKLK